jgi:hypothetical protein
MIEVLKQTNLSTKGEMKMETSINTITVDGVDYVRADQVQAPISSRAIVVVDRGWIFAGDMVRQGGRIKLTRAVHVFRWESIGFDGMIANPKSDKVTLRPMQNSVDIPVGAEVFCIPVEANWGL